MVGSIALSFVVSEKQGGKGQERKEREEEKNDLATFWAKGRCFEKESWRKVEWRRKKREKVSIFRENEGKQREKEKWQGLSGDEGHPVGL